MRGGKKGEYVMKGRWSRDCWELRPDGVADAGCRGARPDLHSAIFRQVQSQELTAPFSVGISFLE